MENKQIVKLYDKKITLEQLLSFEFTSHAKNERKERIDKALRINNNAIVDQVFLVDRFHKNGREVFVVTRSGIIFIFNELSLRFITVLFARPTQLKRLYVPCGLKADKELLYICEKNKQRNLNLN